MKALRYDPRSQVPEGTLFSLRDVGIGPLTPLQTGFCGLLGKSQMFEVNLLLKQAISLFIVL